MPVYNPHRIKKNTAHVVFFIKWSSSVQVGWYLVFLGYIAALPFYVPSPHQSKPRSLMGKMSMFFTRLTEKNLPPPKKTRSSDMFVLGLIWIVRFEEFNSTNLKLPNAEVLGDGDMEAWASWPGISEVFWWFEIPGGPSEVWCKPEKSNSDVIDL